MSGLSKASRNKEQIIDMIHYSECVFIVLIISFFFPKIVEVRCESDLGT